MPRFVVLRHETPPGLARPTHWDFMLECGDMLRTWALLEGPSPGREIVAEELPDHRSAYLDYEGEVSGGRGTVMRWDEGTYEILSGSLALHATSPLTPALSAAGKREMCTIRVVLQGGKIAGEVVLTPIDQPAHAGRSPESAAAGPESSRHTPCAVTGSTVTVADGTRSVPATLPRYWKFSWKGN